MIKNLLAILLVLIISSCSCKTRFIGSEVIIPEHQKLEGLTQDEVNSLSPTIRQKLERDKARLIGNIRQLEKNIKTHNDNVRKQQEN